MTGLKKDSEGGLDAGFYKVGPGINSADQDEQGKKG